MAEPHKVTLGDVREQIESTGETPERGQLFVAMFDRWLAAHDAEVRKAALEETAADLHGDYRDAGMLRARAAALGDALKGGDDA